MRQIAVAFFLFCLAGNAGAVELSVGEKANFEVKTAVSEEDLAKGLMFVRKLPDRHGMWFDLRKYVAGNVGMWMKNTYIELDMLFVDCDFKVVYIYERARPLSLKMIKSPKPFCYVLEINGGEARQYSLSSGDEVKIKTSD